jgi:hypothetical protein
VKLMKHTVPKGTATAQLMVDSPQSVIADLKQDTIPLTTRASVFAQFMASSLIEQRIAAVMGLPADAITAEGPFSGPGQALNGVTPSEARGPQVAAQAKLYRLLFVAQDQLPIITVSAQGPTPTSAARLADAVYPALNGYLQQLQGQTSNAENGAIPATQRVTLRQLGPAQAGSENTSGVMVLAAAAAFAVLLIGVLGILLLDRARPKQSRPMNRQAEAPAHDREDDEALGGEERPELYDGDYYLDLVELGLAPAVDYETNGAGPDVDSPHSPTPIG